MTEVNPPETEDGWLRRIVAQPCTTLRVTTLRARLRRGVEAVLVGFWPRRKPKPRSCTNKGITRSAAEGMALRQPSPLRTPKGSGASERTKLSGDVPRSASDDDRKVEARGARRLQRRGDGPALDGALTRVRKHAEPKAHKERGPRKGTQLSTGETFARGSTARRRTCPRVESSSAEIGVEATAQRSTTRRPCPRGRGHGWSPAGASLQDASFTGHLQANGWLSIDSQRAVIARFRDRSRSG